MIEHIKHNENILGIILRSSFQKDGVEFLTHDFCELQLGYMSRPEGYNIEPHVHNKSIRKLERTLEVLLVKSGLVRVDFYTNSKQYLESKKLKTGDIVLLIDGGHGFHMIEKSEIIEVKQGPYLGLEDKTHFLKPKNIN